MVASPDRNPGQPQLRGDGDGRLQRPQGHHLPQTVAPIHPENGPGGFQVDFRLGGNPSLPNPLCVDHQPADPVAVDPAQVGPDQGIAHPVRIPSGNAQGDQHGRGIPAQILGPVTHFAHENSSNEIRMKRC